MTWAAEMELELVMARLRPTTAANLKRLAAWARREAMTADHAPSQASAERVAESWAREALELDLRIRVDELNRSL